MFGGRPCCQLRVPVQRISADNLALAERGKKKRWLPDYVCVADRNGCLRTMSKAPRTACYAVVSNAENRWCFCSSFCGCDVASSVVRLGCYCGQIRTILPEMLVGAFDSLMWWLRCGMRRTIWQKSHTKIPCLQIWRGIFLQRMPKAAMLHFKSCVTPRVSRSAFLLCRVIPAS